MSRNRRRPAAVQQLDLLLVGLKFVGGETWWESRQFLALHPELLTDDGSRAMEELVRRCTGEGQHLMALVINRHHVLLQSCRELGVDAAFAAIGSEGSKMPERDPTLRLAVESLFASSVEDLRALMDQHPELLTDAGVAALEETIAVTEDSGGTGDVTQLRSRLSLVHRSREVGVANAFAEFQVAKEADEREIETWVEELAADTKAAATLTAACARARDVSAWDECIATWDALLARAKAKRGSVPSFLLFQAGLASMLRYELSREDADLDRAERLWAAAVQRDDLDQEWLDVLLPGLADVYRERQRRRGSAADRDKAISLLERALDGTRPVKTRWLADLAALLDDRQGREGDKAAGRRAVELARTVVSRAGHGTDEEKAALLRLPERLRTRLAARDQESVAADQTDPSRGHIRSLRGAIAGIAAGWRTTRRRGNQPDAANASLARSSSPVAVDLQEPLLQFVNSDSWQSAAELAARFPRLLDDDAQDNLHQLADLSRLAGDDVTAALTDRRRAFLLRCREVGRSRALEQFSSEDATLMEVLDEILSAGSPRELMRVVTAHPELSARLAEAYLRQYLQTLRGEGEEQEAAAAAERVEILCSWREGDHFVIPVPPDLVQSALRSVSILLQRWQDTDDLAPLDEAINIGESARREPSFQTADPSDRSHLASQLGVAYAHRFEARAMRSDLDAAVSLIDEGVAVAPVPSEARIDALLQQGALLGQQGRALADRGLLDRAEGALRRLLDELPDDHPDLPLALWNLADTIDDLAQFDPTRQDEAIKLGDRAVTITPDDSPFLAGRLDGLGVFLRHRAARSDRATDLRRAALLQRRGSALAREGSSERANILTHLGNTLLDLYQREPEPQILNESVEALEGALASTLAVPIRRARALSGLGRALTARYQRYGSPDDLEGAREVLSESLALDPRPESGAVFALCTLAAANLAMDGAGAVDGTISMLKSALQSAPRGTLAVDHVRVNLALVLSARYQLKGSPQDANEAEALFAAVSDGNGQLGVAARAGLGEVRVARAQREPTHGDDLDRGIEDLAAAVALMEGGNRLGAMAALAQARADRWERDHDANDRVEAALGFHSVLAEAASTAPGFAVTTALSWSGWALNREAWAEAVEATRRGLASLDDLVRAQVRRNAKEDWIRKAEGLSARAAFARCRARDPLGGALALEIGRALLLSEALERNRLDLEALAAAGYGEVARGYATAAERWTALVHTDQSTAGRADLARRLDRARDDLDAAAAQVRGLAGYSGFGLMPTAEDMLAAATGDVLVYLAAAPPGGIAFVVRPDSDVQAVDLPALTVEALRSHAGAWAATYSERWRDRWAWWDTVERTTRWLWDAVMAPVCAQVPAGQPLALVPSGILGLLPLHAAWRPEGDMRQYVVDDHAVRYVPNARALVEARRRAENVTASGLLAVQDPQPTRHVALPTAAVEVDAACRFLSVGPVQRLVGPAAQLPEVLEAVRSHKVLHFCCHGDAHPQRPLDSGLDLADDARLTVGAVMRSRVQARLVVLSACESGLVGRELPDEVVGLPAAFLEAGAAGVIASLWSVPDLATAVVIDDLFRRWRSGQGQDAASALCAAQSWARQASYEELHERFPMVAEFSPAAVPSVALPLWRSATPLSRPAEWSALTYVGA
jgi:CHAT domain-containing protein/tetratricopeptide (TPR) repeat protein